MRKVVFNQNTSKKKTFHLFFCDFQSYYSDYYSRYIEEYERRQHGVPCSTETPVEDPVVHTCDKETENIGKNIEAALLMDDILNNGINFCAIM